MKPVSMQPTSFDLGRRLALGIAVAFLVACSDEVDSGEATDLPQGIQTVANDEGVSAVAQAQPEARAEEENAGDSAQATALGDDLLITRWTERATGDLDELKKSRVIRALVAYSKTNFFLDKGRRRGVSYELLQEYEKQLNAGIKNPADRVIMAYLPLPFGDILPALAEGMGDVAVAGITITPEREKLVVFSDPTYDKVKEVAVSHKSVSGIESVDDLAGRSVYVRRGSSYIEHMQALNKQFEASGKEPIKITEGHPNISTEDILEMVNARVLELTVADDHIATLWAQVLPDIVVHDDVFVNEGGRIAWAVRQNNPKLLDSVNKFVKNNKAGTLMGNIMIKRYFKATKWISNPTSQEELKRFASMVELFQLYATEYGFDYLALAAQGYQESGLDQKKRSKAGAVGVMQLLPTTAGDKNVGVDNIEELENNIRAGAKYLDFLRNRYFSDPEIPPEAQVDFAWAAYNTGPAKVNQLRKRAAEKGLDPNIWFGNVERVAAAVIGRETVDYVANINKYYIAYKLSVADHEAKQKQLEKLQSE